MPRASFGESLPRAARSTLDRFPSASGTQRRSGLVVPGFPSKSGKERREFTTGAFRGGSALPIRGRSRQEGSWTVRSARRRS